MNLAEFPLALLAERNKAGTVSFVRERALTLQDGTTLQQSWHVTGSPDYGLPHPTDEDVLLGLLKIAADNGFESPVVHFTQTALFNLLQWHDQGFYFKRFEQALARLKTTAIRATNAFWNNATKSYQTRHFGIIESYELFQRRPGVCSSPVVALTANWARFSAEFYSSIQAGYMKPLDLTLYFSLKSSVSKRLYRFLDKKRYKKEQFAINVPQLASVHLGLSESTCRYMSWIRRELDRAHHELTERGFLESAEYGETKNGEPKVTYTFNLKAPACEQLMLPVADPAARVVAMLIERGVSRGIAQELLKAAAPEVIESQIDVFDHLQTMSKAKPLANPGGFLTSAIRQGWNIKPPGYLPPAERQARAHALSRSASEQAVRREHQVNEQATLEKVRSSLPESLLELLWEEAFEQARTQLGPGYKLRRDSRVVEAFLNGILHERYVQPATS